MLLLSNMLMFAVTQALAAAPPNQVRPAPESEVQSLRPLPSRTVGRVVSAPPPGLTRQWPGTYFETAFSGRTVFFQVGPGDVILHVKVDGRTVETLVKPNPGLYSVDALRAGRHVLRIEVASESQAGPTHFGGFYGPQSVRRARLRRLPRQIEFIGDSHTVGYGNTSRTRECTQDEVWRTTDTSQAFGPILARRFGADYQVNAISGRGIVRNYDGFKGDTLPEAYPKALFEGSSGVRDPKWRPQLIVIALGTNDFSTKLKDGEKWKSRAELSADYQASYVRFVKQLRAQNPSAYFILWSTDIADGEVGREVRRVAERLRAEGERRLAYVPVAGLDFQGCHYHPSMRDDQAIADRLAAAIDARRDVWRR